MQLLPVLKGAPQFSKEAGVVLNGKVGQEIPLKGGEG